jgi:hypothetical protein
MNRVLICLIVTSASFGSAPLWGQEDRPDRPGNAPPGERRDDRLPPPPPGEDGGFRFRNEPMRQFDVMRGYIDIVDRFSRLSRDPSTAGVAAVIAAADMLKQKGPDSAIEYFNKLLPEVKNETVQRAIRIQLAELYRHNGSHDKALEQLDVLIKSAGPENASPKQ